MGRMLGIGFRFLCPILFCFVSWIATADQLKSADLIVVNARIYTVNEKQPWAEAMAVRDGKILAVGSTTAIKSLSGPSTRIIDAQDRLLLPGFTDCHVHFMDGSLSLQRVNVEDAKDLADVQRMIKQFAAAHPNDAWVLGRGWSYAHFPNTGGLPTKEMLDAVIPDRPAFIEGYDGHTFWANSKALALAGIDRNTRNPANGIIVRDAKGEPTGALKEDAGDLVAGKVPPPTREQRLVALALGIQHANQLGLTRVHSAGQDFEYLDLYSELRKRGDLTLRFYVAYFLDPPELTPEKMQIIENARRTYDDEWISVGVVKTMLDGVVESHTAAMFTPYSDDPSTSGTLFWSPEKYKAAVLELDRRGYQVFTHAIGDRAVHLALDTYAEAERTNKTTDARDRVEHIETITAADSPRFGKEHVIASFQPLHAYPDDDTLKVWAVNAGPDRASRAWVWKSISSTGGVLAFGSDWPVVTINPWYGLQNALTRETVDRTPAGGWLPEQRISLAAAIRAYTLDAAYAGHCEKTEGSIEPGKLADFIIVSQDLFKVDPHQLRDTKVLITVVGGKPVYESNEFRAQTAATEVHP